MKNMYQIRHLRKIAIKIQNVFIYKLLLLRWLIFTIFNYLIDKNKEI